MLNILICDDNIRFCSELEKGIEIWKEKNAMEVSVEPCYSAKGLYEALRRRDEKPDLLFLDIELGDETGIQAGDYIREELKDETMQIVFVSSYESYAMELFKIRPFDFLVKPVQSAKLEQILTKYCEIFGRSGKGFVYRIRRQTYKIPFDEIMYMKSTGKKIQVMTINGEREYSGILSEAAKQLDPMRFWTIHKSFIVNVDYVSDFGRNHFHMNNGEYLPVSQARWKEVQHKIAGYVSGGKS